MRRLPPRPNVSWKSIRLVAATLFGVVALTPLITAQSAGPNINVLPIVLPTNASPSVFDAALVGDLYLQRQLEPAIAVSTRNPAHLLAFFNDYRAVDVDPSLDQGIGERQASGVFNVAWTYVRQIFARLIGKPVPKAKGSLPAMAAAGVGEAWVGGSRSYDGGQTWSGMFLPGAPFDPTEAGLASPVKGLKGATDPVMAAGPCGKFYVGFLAFDRGGASKMAVATYQDLNNLQGGDTIVYQGTKVLESANNGQWGYFLDKPAIGVDPHRGNPSDPCGHNVYLSYTTFNGLSKDGKAQTKITLARSTNSGQTYSIGKLNQPYQQGQGTAIAVDPTDGTLYIAFRHFNDPDTILVHRSTNFGQTFSGQPMNLLAGSTTPTLQKYDQPTIATDTADPQNDLMFRSLAFPTIAVTGDGTVMVAWTERVDKEITSKTYRQPSAGGTPRVVLMRKAKNSNVWTDINGAAGSRLAIDVGKRDKSPEAPPPPDGLGFLPLPRDAGPQIQPYLSFGAGKLMMLYYESRGYMRPLAPPQQMIEPFDLSLPPSPSFPTGMDRLFDVRAALLNPTTGAVEGSAQVSRYPLKANANLDDGETLDDVLPVYWPCFPDDPTATVPCERRVDRANKPTSKAGTSPFKGDYVGLTPAVQLVPRGDGSGWRWATSPSDVPGRAFFGIFADNRNLVPPVGPPDVPEFALYANYGPPFTSTCTNPGSRNTDVFVSKIDGDVVVSVPTTYKQLENIQRTFPIVVSSGSGVAARYFKLSFSAGGNIASFRQETDLDEEKILVYPFSSATRVAYVGQCHLENGVKVCTAPSTTEPVTVRVQEFTELGDLIGDVGTVTLNADSSNPPVINSGIGTSEIHNPDIGAPDIGAPDIGAPDIGAPDIGAPDIGAPDIGAPDIGAPDIGASAPTDYVSSQDVTWTLNNTGNTYSAYTASVHLDNPEQYGDDYAFQLIIHKTGTFGSLYQCNSFNQAQSRVISVIANPDIGAPDIGAPDIGAPDIGAPDIGAATFAMGPSESASSSSATSATSLSANRMTTEAAAAAPTNDGTLKAPKASEAVKVTLRAYQLTNNPAVIFDPTLSLPAIAIKQQSKNNNNGVLETLGVAVQGADLKVASGAPTLSASTVAAGGSVQVGPWTLQNAGNVDAVAFPDESEGSNQRINNSVYRSADATFGPGDVRIGSAGDAISPLAAGASVSVGPSTVTIASDTPAGTYYLFVVADDGSQSVTGEVNELNEKNNASVGAPLTVTVVNSAPVAGNQPVTTNEDTAASITLAASDNNNDTLTYSIVASPANGSLSGSGANVIYTPAANFNGSDSFTFKANDGTVDSNIATVSITVTAVNDAPTAAVDSYTTNEDTALSVPALGVLGNDGDVDGDALSAVLVAGPAHGTLTLNANGSFLYTPTANYNGPDGFTYRASDGVAASSVVGVSIGVTAVNDAPSAANDSYAVNEDNTLTIAASGILSNDTDPESALTAVLVAGPSHGTLTLNANGSFTFVPVANYNGSDSFTYRANDGEFNSNVATVAITINAVNDAPVANAQTVSVVENTSTQITLSGSDVDLNGLTFAIVAGPAHGTVSPMSGQVVTYTPSSNYEGPDSFTFRVNDGTVNSAAATVTINVTPGVDQYGFIRLLTLLPSEAPPKFKNLGSSLPLGWQYTLGGVVVNTSTELPKVTFTKMNATNNNCTSPAGEMAPSSSTYLENTDFPGNSSFQYDTKTNAWQFNWQTAPPVTAGCWNVRVILPRTGQVNGPFPLRLR